jgi:hypothetical protein
MISLLLPSRERPNYLNEIIENILNTVEDAETIEILLKQDEDSLHKLDIENLSFLRCFTDKKSDSLNRDYYNFLAKESKGEILWSIGDDVRFHTKGWNKIIERKVAEYLVDKTDKIAYIHVTEKGSKAKHPCFPLITKETFNVLNMYFHPQLLSWGADRCLWELYSHNSIRRVLHIHEVEIEHLSYHDGKAEFDKTAQSMKERFFRDPEAHNKVSMYTIPQQIKLLEKYIEEYKNVL